MWKCMFCDHYNVDEADSCVVCGKVKYNKKKSVKLTQQIAKNLAGPDIIIPKEFNAIGKSAFKSRDDIETVTIHAGIENIPKEAFFGCVNLRKVICLGELSSIGSKAFTNCEKLSEHDRPYAKLYIADDAFSSSEDLSILDDWILELKDYINRYNKIINDSRLTPEIIQVARDKVISVTQVVEYLETYKLRIKKGVANFDLFGTYSGYLLAQDSDLEQVERDAASCLETVISQEKENEEKEAEKIKRQRKLKKIKGYVIGLGIGIAVCILAAAILSVVL